MCCLLIFLFHYQMGITPEMLWQAFYFYCGWTALCSAWGYLTGLSMWLYMREPLDLLTQEFIFVVDEALIKWGPHYVPKPSEAAKEKVDVMVNFLIKYDKTILEAQQNGKPLGNDMLSAYYSKNPILSEQNHRDLLNAMYGLNMYREYSEVM